MKRQQQQKNEKYWILCRINTLRASQIRADFAVVVIYQPVHIFYFHIISVLFPSNCSSPYHISFHRNFFLLMSTTKKHFLHNSVNVFQLTFHFILHSPIVRCFFEKFYLFLFILFVCSYMHINFYFILSFHQNDSSSYISSRTSVLLSSYVFST